SSNPRPRLEDCAMYEPLVPCPTCQRHVRTTESACPFCRAALPADLDARAVPAASQRLSRAAAFVFGASLAVTSCGGEVTEDKSASGAEGATSGGMGGATTGGSTTGSTSSASTTGSTSTGPDDDGGNVALYGDPPPRDAGPSDDGGGQADYGAPPP